MNINAIRSVISSSSNHHKVASMDFEERDEERWENDALLEMEIEMQKVNLAGDAYDAHTSAFESIKELGVLQTIQDLKNPESFKFHLFSPCLNTNQDFIFTRALNNNSKRITFVSFESLYNLAHLDALSTNLQYLKINTIDSPVILKSLAKSFKSTLNNIRGLSIGLSLDCIPYSSFLDSILDLSSLLFLRLSGDFSEGDVKKISNVLNSNKNLVHLGVHNCCIEPCTIYEILEAITHHNCLRTLDLKMTLTNEEIVTELAECLSNNHSISQLIFDDTHPGLAGSKLEKVLRTSRFLQSLQITPDFGSSNLYKQSFIIDCMQSEDDLIVQYCRANMKRVLMQDLRCLAAVRLASNLKIFSTWIPIPLLLKIVRPAFSFFTDEEFEVVGKSIFKSRTVSISSPFPFDATEYLRRCYCLLPENISRDYDFGPVETELHSAKAPDYFSYILKKRRDVLYDPNKEFHYF